MAMSNILSSFKKKFYTSFNLPLTGYPLDCQVAEAYLYGKLLEDKTLLAFGKYNLIFCFNNHRENFYPVHLTSRTFCEKFEVTETLPKDIEIKPYFSQPLYAVTRPGKQQNPTLLSLVKNIFLFHTWIEVHIEGEITVEVIVNKTHEPAKIIPGKKLNVTCSEQKNILINQVKTAQAGVKQIKPDASTGVTVPFPAFYLVSKNQIPDHMKLRKTFLQKYTPPPSKPE